jgi:hypothetical protein
MKWEITVLDIKEDTPNESMALSILAEKGWELVNVVSLPLCRRAYLKREIPKTQPPELSHLLIMEREIPEEPANQKPVDKLDQVAPSAITNPRGESVDSAHSTDYGGWA